MLIDASVSVRFAGLEVGMNICFYRSWADVGVLLSVFFNCYFGIF